ncbi:hypothetical protein CDAR_76661 [Caerostris darwini]|uniref:Uncharacterized protein n=1 Tax=Caerostris darwini TaxID=1538125 RepID=A0AAV4QC07_9ARAC|nr:hypothetical protein CDAR_76661 [Caerostris darwini]
MLRSPTEYAVVLHLITSPTEEENSSNNDDQKRFPFLFAEYGGKEGRTRNPTPRVTRKCERVIFRESAGAILNPFLSRRTLPQTVSGGEDRHAIKELPFPVHRPYRAPPFPFRQSEKNHAWRGRGRKIFWHGSVDANVWMRLCMEWKFKFLFEKLFKMVFQFPFKKLSIMMLQSFCE